MSYDPSHPKQKTIIEHRFNVPNKSAFSDLSVAIEWAKEKAQELGISTKHDNWCSIEADEDGMSLVISEIKTVKGALGNPR